MGGYTAIKLCETYNVQNLFLFAPAVYDIAAFDVNFGQTFTEIIRKPKSWRNSDAFSILKKFTGNIIIFIGDRDDVIPTDLINLLYSNLPNATSKEMIIIPDALIRFTTGWPIMKNGQKK